MLPVVPLKKVVATISPFPAINLTNLTGASLTTALGHMGLPPALKPLFPWVSSAGSKELAGTSLTPGESTCISVYALAQCKLRGRAEQAMGQGTTPRQPLM